MKPRMANPSDKNLTKGNTGDGDDWVSAENSSDKKHEIENNDGKILPVDRGNEMLDFLLELIVDLAVLGESVFFSIIDNRLRLQSLDSSLGVKRVEVLIEIFSLVDKFIKEFDSTGVRTGELGTVVLSTSVDKLVLFLSLG